MCVQVQERAEECIRALNLILDISSGKQVTNLLSLNFDWTLLKVSEEMWAYFVNSPTVLFDLLYYACI